MIPELNERGQTLRIVRFFLPRLRRQELANEIEDEKNRLRIASQMRVSEIQRDSKNRIDRETSPFHSRLVEYERQKNRSMLILVLASIAIIGGILAFVVQMGLGGGIPVAIAGGVALIWASINLWRVASKARSCRNEIESLKSAIHQTMEKEIATEKTTIHNGLISLDARLDELVRLYEDSIASEEEVAEFCNDRLEELQGLVAPALGIHSDDILDERSAEIWAPSFLQAQEFPLPVLRDAAQSEKEIRDWADDIIAPMQVALPKEDQWLAFRRRVLRMLGLRQSQTDSANPDQDKESEFSSLNALQAVRFSTSRQTYLAGHYFYQKIVCAEDMIGIFRAYVNVLNRRIPHTFALQILYSDITAIGIETAFNREHFGLSAMTIDQHTHTLTLELSSGTSYRMSGDAGSDGQIESSGDREAAKVVSQANQAFRDQIINVRALIRDSKAS